MTNREKIWNEILAERDYQITRWGTKADERTNRPSDWVLYLSHYSSRWMDGSFAPYSRETLEGFRASMIKTATLALAAIEETDKILTGENLRSDILVGQERDFEEYLEDRDNGC
jgi:chaperone required for assembly of F1-ATPase